MTLRIPVAAIVFDFDGVLAESVEVKGEAFCTLYDSHGPDIQRKVLAYHRAHGGISRFDKIRHFEEEFVGRPVTSKDVNHLAQRFSALVEDRVIAAPWVAGARDFLEQFYQILPLFVASATPQEEIERIVKARRMAFYFKGVFGSPEKKSAHLQTIARTYGFPVSRILMVGDTVSDYNAAAESGTAFLGRHISNIPCPFPEGTPTIADLRELGSRIVPNP